MSFLSDIQKHFTEIGKSYTKFYTDKVKQITDDVQKEITYISSLDEELGGLVDDISNVEDLGEAIEMASTLADAFGENPLVAQLMQKIEDDYGVSISSPLELTKMIVTGGDHPYFKVAAAMIRFPVTGAVTSAKLGQLSAAVTALAEMVASVDPAILSGMESQDTSQGGGVPGEVITLLNQARSKLATPHLDGPYKSAISDVQEAINKLSDAKVWAGAEFSNVTKLALTTALNSAYSKLSEYWPDIKSGFSEMQDAITTINTTTISPAGAGKRLGKIRKIRLDIANEVQKMSDDTISQAAIIPQYLITLGSIKKMLELSQPRPSDGTPAPVVTPIGAWDSALVSEIESLIGKIINFSKKPYTVDAFLGYAATLGLRLEEYYVMYASTVLQVEANWAVFPGVKELLQGIKSLLDTLGFDNAADALDLGDIEGFADMSEITALSTGSTMVAFTQVAGIAYQLGQFGLKDKLDKEIASVKKKYEKQKFENKAKKKNRLEDTKKRLKKLNESFEKFQSFYADFTGIVEALSSVAELST